MVVRGWLGAAGRPDGAVPAAAAPTLVEAEVDVADALLAADGLEVSALAASSWARDLSDAPSLRAALARAGEDDGPAARVLAAAAAPGGVLQLRVDVDAGVLHLARHRPGALVHALVAMRWAERSPARSGTAAMAARLGVSALPRARTTAWRALDAVRTTTRDLVARALAAGVRPSETALLAEVARLVLALGDGPPRTTPERAVAYARAGVGAEEVWASERLPEVERPSTAQLQVLAALTGGARW